MFDFVGGIVVYINVVMVGIVGVFVVGKWIGYGKEFMVLYFLIMIMIGVFLLWVGWFGFNVGLVLEVGDIVVLVFVNILLVMVVVVLFWVFGEWVLKGKLFMLGGVFGVVVGLVVIILVCGFVGLMGVLVIGFIVGVVCLWGVSGLKCLLGVDDLFDVFGVYGVGGMFGVLLIGVFVVFFLGG